MTLTPQWLDELRARTTLSALIGRSIKVTKAGREYKACCPFHNEKTPSFTINDEKGFYHCFGCGAHGDAIRWMTDQRGLGFMDAVKELADAAGMQVPAPDPKAAAKAERANTLYDVMAAAQEWFVQQFQGLEGAEARAYCERRGLKAETLKAFGIGYAPDSRSKLKDALKQFGVDKLVEAGLLIAVDNKEPYDRFRGRLMIPIRDPRGRVIAFGGRILGAGEPKYLNSPDTPLFDKGRTLYNLDKASPASRSSGRVIVVEGYMDVIALAQAGFGEAVAPLGTALTEQQISLLWRLSSEPILAFDGDSAGQKAAMRAAIRSLPILGPTNTLKILTLPEGQDPDDIIRNGQTSVFANMLKAARPLADWIWEYEVQNRTFDTPEQRSSLRQDLDDLSKSIQHTLVKKEYAWAWKDRTYQYFASAAREHYISGRSKGYFSRRTPITEEARQIAKTGLGDYYVKALIYGLMIRPWFISKYFEPLVVIASRQGIENKNLSILLREELWDRMIREAQEDRILDQAQLLKILSESHEFDSLIKIRRSNVLPFSFTKSSKAPHTAIEQNGLHFEKHAETQLSAYIRALVEIPETDSLIDQLNARARRMGDDANELQAAVKRLNRQKAELLEELSSLGSAEADN